MYKAVYYTHLASVILFLVIYLVKTVLLLANSTEKLSRITKAVKVPEMIISFLFLGTGVYMLTQLPEINKFMIIKLVCVFVSIPLAIIGFKKSNKILASIAFLLIVAAYGLAEMSKKRSAVPGNENASMDGKTIYTANCVKCHGDDGKAGIMGAADLSETTLDKVAIHSIIKDGKGQMAGFSGTLTDAQIDAVIAYVNSLKK